MQRAIDPYETIAIVKNSLYAIRRRGHTRTLLYEALPSGPAVTLLESEADLRGIWFNTLRPLDMVVCTYNSLHLFRGSVAVWNVVIRLAHGEQIELRRYRLTCGSARLFLCQRMAACLVCWDTGQVMGATDPAFFLAPFSTFNFVASTRRRYAGVAWCLGESYGAHNLMCLPGSVRRPMSLAYQSKEDKAKTIALFSSKRFSIDVGYLTDQQGKKRRAAVCASLFGLPRDLCWLVAGLTHSSSPP